MTMTLLIFRKKKPNFVTLYNVCYHSCILADSLDFRLFFNVVEVFQTLRFIPSSDTVIAFRVLM